jgi:hypothetical protein
VLVRMAFEVRQARTSGMFGAFPLQWEKYKNHAADPIFNKVYEIFIKLGLEKTD